MDRPYWPGKCGWPAPYEYPHLAGAEYGQDWLVMEDDKVAAVLDGVKRLDEENTDVGIRAFVWNIESSY